MTIALVWKVLYYSWLLTELYVALITRTRRGGGKIDDRGSLYVLWVVIGCSISLAYWAGAVYAPGHIHGAPWLASVTLAFLAVGLAVRWSAIYTLGRAFSANVAIHATQTLNQSGPFRYMRHPSYTGMVLIFIAVGLSTRNWLGFAIVLVGPVAALLYRIHVEEAALTNAFGPAYIDYSQRVKRLVPGIY